MNKPFEILQSDWTANILQRGTKLGIGLRPDLSHALRSGSAQLVVKRLRILYVGEHILYDAHLRAESAIIFPRSSLQALSAYTWLKGLRMLF